VIPIPVQLSVHYEAVREFSFLSCNWFSDVTKATGVKAKATTFRCQGHDPQRPKPKATICKAKVTATCCHSTASARQRTADESTLFLLNIVFTKLSSTRNLFNNSEQSLNCYLVMGNHN